MRPGQRAEEVGHREEERKGGDALTSGAMVSAEENALRGGCWLLGGSGPSACAGTGRVGERGRGEAGPR